MVGKFFKCFPTTSDPAAYKVQLESLGISYKEPLASCIYDSNFVSCHNTRRKWIAPNCSKGLEPILTGFSLPEVIAVSGNCVTSDFNRNPAHPRLYSMRDAELMVYTIVLL